MNKYKRMFLVKREVYANNIKQAMYAKGKIYSIEECEDKFQPEHILNNKIVGFNKIKTKIK